MRKGIKPTVNIKFFFEGEEEAGSPNLREILTKHKDLLKADAFIVCDGPVHQSGRKQVVFGVRGDVECRSHGLRSEPAAAQRALRQLVAESGDDAREAARFDEGRSRQHHRQRLGRRCRAARAGRNCRRSRTHRQYDDELKKQLGIAYTEGGGKSLLELINQPSLNINGIKSGDVGDLARNVIPTTANAVLDLRLVKGNDHIATGRET